MAKRDITRRCGHDEVHNLVGTNAHGERDKKAERLAEGLCRDCYRTEQREQRQHEQEQLLGYLVLPELTGSDKQISWAQDLRRATLAVLGTTSRVMEVVQERTNAKWWIDHRQSGSRDTGAHAGDALLAALEPTEADRAATRVVTRQLLEDPLPREGMSVRDPHWRPRSGTTCPSVLLAPVPSRALSVWQRLITARQPKIASYEAIFVDPARLGLDSTGQDELVLPRELDEDVVEEWVSENPGELAEFVAAVLADARAQPALSPRESGYDRARWELANRLVQRWKELHPPELPPRGPEFCRHGVSFSDDCQACDDEAN